MSTNINALVQGLDRRWDEVSLLLSIAEELDDEDPKLTPVCKALTVLMVANLEGYLQEIIKSLIADINDNSYFRNTHYKMKTYSVSTICSRTKELRSIHKSIDFKV